MSIFTAIGAFFKKIFTSIKDDADTVAITITEYVKLALDSGVLKTIAALIPGNLPGVVIDALTGAIPKILAIELALQGLPDNATGDQIEAFLESVETAILSKDELAKSKFWTNYAASLYNTIEVDINNNPNHNLTFAQIVEIVENAFQAYKDSKNTDETND